MSLTWYNHGFGDFLKIAFFKKTCPQCNGRLKRYSDKEEYIETREYRDDEYNVGKALKVTFYYFCDSCNIRVEVSDLKWK
ncbi:MAG: hypothetical protein N3B21_02955 [Clostridia bacterium]|nr:hypothetical protein [Clostridia bacterium]